MNSEYRYILEKGSKKHICPDCGTKRFVRYIDIETGEYLPIQYGRCDKGDSHFFLNPYTDGYAKAIWEQEKGFNTELPKHYKPNKKKLEPKNEVIFFDFETFKQTLQPERYKQNNFIQNLLSNVPFPFEADEVTKVIELYRLGTVINGYRAGSITFPYIDINQNIRAIQVKNFDIRNNTIATDFLHSIIEKSYIRNNLPLPEWLISYINQDKRISCLFGEHLLNNYPNANVFLFEAPKTAIYNSLYFGFPEQSNIISLAVYNKGSFSFDKLKILEGRTVFIFPDLSKDGSTFNEWQTKAKNFEKQLINTRIMFSDLLEKYASEQDKQNGNDLADFLIKQDWRKFRIKTIKQDDGITEITNEITEFENRIAKTRRLNEGLENTFNEIAKQIDFYKIAPKFIQEPKNEITKIKELIYWTQ